MTPLEALAKLPAKPVPVILEQLVALRRASIEDPDVVAPLVTVILRTGRTYTGFVINRAMDEKYGEYLLFHVPGGEMPHADALYVATAHVDAVIVHDIGAVAHALSFGAIDAPIGGEPPTRLGVRSKTDQLSKDLSAAIGSTIAFEIVFEGMADSAAALVSLVDGIKDTTASLKDLGRDALGKEAISKAIQKVQFAEGPKGVKLESGTLRVSATWAQSTEGRLAKPALRSGISAVL